jgi:DNA-binding Xre family transcriptional regulator
MRHEPIKDTLKFLSKPKNVKALELLKKNYKGSEVAKIVGLSQTTLVKIKRIGLVKQVVVRD